MYFLNRNICQYCISGQGEDDWQTPTAIGGRSGYDWIILSTTAIFLCILSFFGFLVAPFQLVKRGWKNPDNYIQLASYTLTLIFIISLLMGNDNWCSTPWQWQTGAFAVFFSWVNFIFILKYMPYTAIPINRFLSICVAFLKLIFLPIVLILAFSTPFYMVFVKVS